MSVVRAGFESVKAIVGKQAYSKSTTYRASHFLIETEHADGVLMYHTLTGELLLSNSANWEHDERLKEELAEKWFLVPEDFDEILFCDQCKEIAGLLKPNKEYVNRFIVFTTTDCNARCFYCFEMGQKRVSMTAETASDAAEYMLRVSRGKKISIRWFGGEPLFNSRVIDIISKKLREGGAAYSSTMVSNSYLFDDALVDRAVRLWNLKNVLVTIDGTEEVYNKTKAYIYKGGSAFQRVLSNLEKLVDAGISLTVNLNMDRRNTEDLMKLADELGARFRNRTLFQARAVPLKEYVGKINAFVNDDEALQMLERLNKKLESYGIREKLYLNNTVKLNSCMADDPHSVTILPDGRIGRCEHFGDSEEVGTIYGSFDDAKVASWRVRRQREERCKTCHHYPSCIRLQKCNAYSPKCDYVTRTRLTVYLREKIINTYERWKDEHPINMKQYISEDAKDSLTL